jgi:hypothetical protein
MKLRTKKLRARGETGKYDDLTVSELKDLLKKKQIVGRSKLKTRYQMIEFLENLKL